MFFLYFKRFLFFLFLVSTELSAGTNSTSLNNTEVISSVDTILLYLETNPAKSDSISKSLLLRFPGDIFAEGIANYYQGESAYFLQKFSEAVGFYQTAIDCFSLTKDSVRLSSTFNNIGLVYYNRGNYDKALNAFSKSLSFEILLNNKEGIAQSYQNIALIFDQGGQQSKAVEYYQKALDIYFEIDKSEDAAGVYNNIAAIYASGADYSEAESYYFKALDIYAEMGLKSKESIVLCNIGALMLRQQRWDEGSLIIERALVLMKSDGNKIGQISAYSILGDLYVAKKEFQQAVFIYNKAKELSVELNCNDLLLGNIYSLYLAYKKAGLFELALEAHEQYIAISDSLINENPVYYQGIVNHELEMNLAQQALKSYKAEVKKNVVFVILIIAVIIALGYLILFMIRRRNKLRLLHKKNNKQLFINSPTDLHFVYSMLSSLHKYITSGKDKLALEHLNNVSALLKNILKNSGRGFVPVINEIEFIEAYFSIQKQRFTHDIKLAIVSNINKEEVVLLPFMITKPFVEKMINNGIRNNNGLLNFNISFIRKHDLIEVTIEENGLQSYVDNELLKKRLLSPVDYISEKGIYLKENTLNSYCVRDVFIENKSKQGKCSGVIARFSVPVVTSN